ncbi:MAG: ATP-binding protein [Acidimicrobiia bacterium]|nr:ATP-binding protein [Acidimicrobiia bacterium]
MSIDKTRQHEEVRASTTSAPGGGTTESPIPATTPIGEQHINIFEFSLVIIEGDKISDVLPAEPPHCPPHQKRRPSLRPQSSGVSSPCRDPFDMSQPGRCSRDPQTKILDNFDFLNQRLVSRPQIANLHQIDFLPEVHNTFFLEPPDIGKTHLFIAMDVHAAHRDHQVAVASATPWSTDPPTSRKLAD